MHATGVIESMKDFYWDIRPKPEFGTIEVRVMDTPLTVQRACDIAAYIQALARYLLLSRPFMPQEDDYLVYTFNRFQACRFGLEGEYVHPNELTRMPIADHILSICDALEPHAEALGSLQALANIRAQAASRDNDAHWVRTVNGEAHSLRDTVRRTCEQWEA
jgi:carboxylate-amine ligase